jgi:hypothetical protein
MYFFYICWCLYEYFFSHWVSHTAVLLCACWCVTLLHLNFGALSRSVFGRGVCAIPLIHVQQQTKMRHFDCSNLHVSKQYSIAHRCCCMMCTSHTLCGAATFICLKIGPEIHTVSDKMSSHTCILLCRRTQLHAHLEEDHTAADCMAGCCSVHLYDSYYSIAASCCHMQHCMSVA